MGRNKCLVLLVTGCSVQGPLQLGHNREATLTPPFKHHIVSFLYAVTHSDTESGISARSDVCEISETTDSSKSCMHLLGMEMAVQ